jgi:hypothetical protein
VFNGEIHVIVVAIVFFGAIFSTFTRKVSRHDDRAPPVFIRDNDIVIRL